MVFALDRDPPASSLRVEATQGPADLPGTDTYHYRVAESAALSVQPVRPGVHKFLRKRDYAVVGPAVCWGKTLVEHGVEEAVAELRFCDSAHQRRFVAALEQAAQRFGHALRINQEPFVSHWLIANALHSTEAEADWLLAVLGYRIAAPAPGKPAQIIRPDGVRVDPEPGSGQGPLVASDAVAACRATVPSWVRSGRYRVHRRAAFFELFPQAESLLP